MKIEGTPAPESTEDATPQENEIVEKQDVDSPEKKETSVDQTIETDHITQDEEGNFVMLVDPENPKSTVYKGKSLDELLFNVKKGIIEHDATISRMKSQGFSPKAGKDANVKGNAPITNEVQAPDDDKILNDTLKEFGLDPKVLNWTKEDWQDFERENLATATWELKQKVERAQSVFNARIGEENVVYVNNLNLANEVQLAVDTLVEYGYSPDDINLDEVIERVKSNPRYWQADGIRVPGAIANELTKEITKKAETKAVKKTEKEIALNPKRVVISPKKSTSESNKNDDNKNKASSRYSLTDARTEILKEMKAKGLG